MALSIVNSTVTGSTGSNSINISLSLAPGPVTGDLFVFIVTQENISGTVGTLSGIAGTGGITTTTFQQASHFVFDSNQQAIDIWYARYTGGSGPTQGLVATISTSVDVWNAAVVIIRGQDANNPKDINPSEPATGSGLNSVATSSNLTTSYNNVVVVGVGASDQSTTWASSGSYTLQQSGSTVGTNTGSIAVETEIISTPIRNTAQTFSGNVLANWGVSFAAFGFPNPFTPPAYSYQYKTTSYSSLDFIPSNTAILSGGAVVVNPNVMQWTATWDRTFVNYINDWQPPNNVELLSPIQIMGQSWFCL